MKYTRTKADVVIVGLGWAGSLMAEELTRAGLNVVAIERGAYRETSRDFPTTRDPDELAWGVRRKIMSPPSQETYTIRNNASQTALPARQLNNLTVGNNVGGAGTHWASATWRFTPSDFKMKSMVAARYGDKQFVDGMIIQDWGVSYEELEPFYDRFEKIAATSGKAGVLNGQKVAGGNPFEGSRSSEYPTPPLVRSKWNDMFADLTTEMGYNPFPVPAGTIGAHYKNPLGIDLAPCTYCGFCAAYGCGNWSKSSPNACVVPALMQRTNFSMLTECYVQRVDLTADRKHATGVTFIDSAGNTGEQPADIVIITAYQLDNLRLMLLSGIGKPYNPQTGEGVIGRAYSFQTLSYGYLFFENQHFNPFISTGALATQIDDFNGDNFDHSGLGFVGGAGIQSLSNGSTPIGLTDCIPIGSKRWGSEWKKTYKSAFQNYAMIQGQGTGYSHIAQFADLDPHYTDPYGQPLLRITYDYNENDKRSGRFVRDRIADIAKRTNAKHVDLVTLADDPYSVYSRNDSSHTIGGVVMGEDPKTSALNRYQQSWDVSNVFVSGASSFPNNAGYNPTGTIGALTLWTARAIIERYMKSPGPLVSL